MVTNYISRLKTMNSAKILSIGAVLCTGVYLFVTAPSELPDGEEIAKNTKTVSAQQIFNTANSINDAARFIYTKQIVGPGSKVGFKFGEDWAEPGIEKGPLPALFLRIVAGRMETKPEPLGLYLGSDEPINASNLFSSEQMEQFQSVKNNNTPSFSEADSEYLVAMYPDVASAQACVDCHNEHPDSPKTDWKLNDIMGATTWTYPNEVVTETDLLDNSRAVFAAVEESYIAYLEKAKSFEEPVDIGNSWPTDGTRSLPDADTFMAEVRAMAGKRVVFELLLANLTPEETIQ